MTVQLIFAATMLTFFTFSCKMFQPTEGTKAVSKITIADQLNNRFKPIPEVFEIIPTEENKISTTNGTRYTIDKNTFQGSGKVRLEIRETLSPFESYSLHLPMVSESGEVFESDGMFRIDTQAKLSNSKGINITLNAVANSPMNVYAWIDGKWKFQGKNQYRSSPEEADPGSGPVRSYNGVVPNTWYNFDIPIPESELSCIAIKVPEKEEFLNLSALAVEGRSAIESIEHNAQTVGITFRMGVKVNLLLLGPENRYWAKQYILMPQSAQGPRACQILEVRWNTMSASLIQKIHMDPLEAIRRKYGRIAQIITKSEQVYVGYFNQHGANMTIQTVNGEVSVPVSSIQKVILFSGLGATSKRFFDEIITDEKN